MTATGSVTPTVVPTDVTAPARKPRKAVGRRRVYTRKQRWTIGVLNLAVFFTVWQIAATYTDIPKLFLPSVTEVWDAEGGDAFKDKVIEYASKFAPPNMASMAIGHIKRSVQTGAEIPLQDGLAVERELQSLLFKSQDAKEGIAAYVEKRKGVFKGK